MQNHSTKTILYFLYMFHVTESAYVTSTYLQLLSSTEVVNDVFLTESTESMLACSFLCLNTQNCSATTYNSNDGVCKVVVNTPKYKLLLARNRQHSETFVVNPCLKTPSLCQNDGWCKESKEGKGYRCTCQIDYEGEHCEILKELCPWDAFEFYRTSKLCYYVGTELASYQDALENCKAKNATLAIGSSEETIETIFEIAKEYRLGLTVGLVKTGNVWRWLDNSTNTIKWRLPFEPSGDGNCAHIFPTGDGLNDIACRFIRQFLCQRKNILDV